MVLLPTIYIGILNRIQLSTLQMVISLLCNNYLGNEYLIAIN